MPSQYLPQSGRIQDGVRRTDTAFLGERGQATRSQINAECFRGKVPKALIDASLEQLLVSTPPKITVQQSERADGAPGAPLRVYRLTAS